MLQLYQFPDDNNVNLKIYKNNTDSVLYNIFNLKFSIEKSINIPSILLFIEGK